MNVPPPSSLSMYSSPIYDKWNKIKKYITEEQCKPMDELLHLEGLDEVKNVALSIYTDVLADKKLKSKGYSQSVVPKSLNFAFVGNPGKWLSYI